MQIYNKRVKICCFLLISRVIIIADVISRSNVQLHILHVMVMESIGKRGWLFQFCKYI